MYKRDITTRPGINAFVDQPSEQRYKCYPDEGVRTKTYLYTEQRRFQKELHRRAKKSLRAGNWFVRLFRADPEYIGEAELKQLLIDFRLADHELAATAAIEYLLDKEIITRQDATVWEGADYWGFVVQKLEDASALAKRLVRADIKGTFYTIADWADLLPGL